jgi:hypothetical protein
MIGLHEKTSTGSKGEDVLQKILGPKYEKCHPKEGDGYYVGKSTKYLYEVKTTDLDIDSTGGINQVRPIKCITVIVYFRTRGLWAILSPYDVFNLTVSKTRGQHNECVLECTQISINAIPKSCIYSRDTLIKKMESLCQLYESEKFINVKNECTNILNELKNINENSKKTIHAMVKS